MKILSDIELNLRTITGSAMCMLGTVQLTLFPQGTADGWSAIVIITGAMLLIFGEWYNEKHKDRRAR